MNMYMIAVLLCLAAHVTCSTDTEKQLQTLVRQLTQEFQQKLQDVEKMENIFQQKHDELRHSYEERLNEAVHGNLELEMKLEESMKQQLSVRQQLVRIQELNRDVTGLDQLETDALNMMVHDEVVDEELMELVKQTVNTLTQVEDVKSHITNTNSLSYDERYSFSAMLKTHHTGNAPIVFDTALHNKGSVYNPSTGVWTAPMDGVYQFSISLRVRQSGSEDAIAKLLVNDKCVAKMQAADAETSSMSSLRMSLELPLVMGQEVKVIAVSMDEVLGNEGDYQESWFSGHLVEM